MFSFPVLGELQKKYFASDKNDYTATWDDLEAFGCIQTSS